MISNIDQIKAAIDIVEFISSHVKLKKQGSEMVACCPFHVERSPSFKVSKSKDIYKCFGCGASGDAISFTMAYNNQNYIEAIEYIAKHYGIEVESETKEYVKPPLRLEKLQPDTIKYFESRGISNNTLLRFNVTECVEWMPIAKAEIRAICFNYMRDGELVNVKYRAKGKDFKLHKNSELIFYNLDAIKCQETAVICEGEIDCLSLYEAGIYNAVSVPNGAGIGNQQLRYLDNCWDNFTDAKRIIIFTDNDTAGNKLKDELSRRLGIERCFFVTYPEGCKDANEVLLKHGKEYLKEMVFSAKAAPIEGVISVEDVYNDVVNFYENGYPKGDDCGIEGFDEILTFKGGLLTVVTGSPSSGKSEFLDYITTSLSRRHGWKWGICSFENPVSLHVTKLMEKFAGLAFDFRKNFEHRMNRDSFNRSIIMADDYFKFLNISQIDVTIDGILSKLRELVLRNGIKGVVIDPWNYIEHKIPIGQSETQYISDCISKIREFAVRTDTHIFVVAHPRKLQKDLKTGQYPVATMYDISGSAHFFNKTDNGISVHRDFANGVVTVYVQKVRFSWHGKVDFATFNFDTFTRQYKRI